MIQNGRPKAKIEETDAVFREHKAVYLSVLLSSSNPVNLTCTARVPGEYRLTNFSPEILIQLPSHRS